MENQRFEILRFCKKNSLEVGAWIEETISGTLTPDKRELGRLLSHIRKDDLIICSELSRLGRSLFMIMSILNLIMEKSARIWTIKDSYRLGDDIQSKVLAFAFGLSAEIERNLISQRTKEALALKKAQNVHLGRPTGKKKQRAYSGRRGIPDKDNAPLGHEHKPNRAFCGCLPQHNKKMPGSVNLSRQARQ